MVDCGTVGVLVVVLLPNVPSRSSRACIRSLGVAVWFSWLAPYWRATVPVNLNMSSPRVGSGLGTGLGLGV